MTERYPWAGASTRPDGQLQVPKQQGSTDARVMPPPPPPQFEARTMPPPPAVQQPRRQPAPVAAPRPGAQPASPAQPVRQSAPAQAAAPRQTAVYDPARYKADTANILNYEKFKGNAYKDAVGKWTVGYGQTEIDGRPVTATDTIDEPTARKFVDSRSAKNWDAITRASGRPLSDQATGALMSMTYNTGAGVLGNFKDDLQKADYPEIARHMKLYNKATVGGVKKTLPGLVRRREDEARRLQSGKYQQ